MIPVLEAVSGLKCRHVCYTRRRHSCVPIYMFFDVLTSTLLSLHAELAVQISSFVPTSSCPIVSSTIWKYWLGLQVQTARDIFKSSLVPVYFRDKNSDPEFQHISASKQVFIRQNHCLTDGSWGSNIDRGKEFYLFWQAQAISSRHLGS